MTNIVIKNENIVFHGGIFYVMNEFKRSRRVNQQYHSFSRVNLILPYGGKGALCALG